MRSRHVVAGFIGVSLMLSSCSDGSSEEPSFAVTDSAGVEVVTTRVPTWPNGGRSPWRLSLVTEIGQLDGAEPYLLGGPVQAALLPDGRIAVADDQSADIRVFSAEGDFLSRWGQRGDGPGEFRGFSWITMCGAGLTAFDWRLRRVTTYSLGGELLSTEPFVTPDGDPPYRSKCLPDGSVLAGGWGDHPTGLGPGVHFFSMEAPVWRLFLSSGGVDTLGTYTSAEWVNRTSEAGGGTSGRHPFGRAVTFAGSESQIVIGTSERLQLELRDLDGTLSRIVRGPDADLVIDEAFLDTYRSAPLTEGDSAARATLAQGDFPMPPRYPAYSEIIVDDLGHVWVERFVLPWSAERQWGVFDPDGVFLGHVTFPGDFQATGIGSDRVIGLATDELGVIQVRLYRLDREPVVSADRETRSN